MEDVSKFWRILYFFLLNSHKPLSRNVNLSQYTSHIWFAILLPFYGPNDGHFTWH